jgi:hypothetical protein
MAAYSIFQLTCSPPFSGTSCDSPIGTVSGSVHASRLSVMVSVLTGRP